MKHTVFKKANILCFLFSFAAMLPLPGQELETCTDSNCHGNLMGSKYVHGIAEESCETCHERNSGAHPADFGREFSLTDSMPALCFMCHEEFTGAENIHQPVKDGDCAACHNPHSAEYETLLVGQIPDLCFTCHGWALGKQVNKSENIEAKINGSSYVHAPAGGGECSFCHNVHASDHSYLLTYAFPKGLYAEGKKENYELCFNCHDSDLLVDESGEAITEFRNNGKNLHYVHVKKEKGRSCSTCHNMHGSNNSHLLEEYIQFGDWKMPLNYKESEMGGTCWTGCHQRLDYDRSD